MNEVKIEVTAKCNGKTYYFKEENHRYENISSILHKASMMLTASAMRDWSEDGVPPHQKYFGFAEEIKNE